MAMKIKTQSDRDFHRKGRANARLFDAALELLAACQLALAFVTGGGAYRVRYERETEAALRAAITKAAPRAAERTEDGEANQRTRVEHDGQGARRG